MTTPPPPLRRIFPPAGLRYRLFDSAVFVLLLSAFWYVLTDASRTTTSALADSLLVFWTVTVWGAALCAAGLFAAVCAYLPRRWVRAGYVVLASACGGWSVSLLVGLVLTRPEWQLTGKTLGSALLFAWVARGLISEVLAYSESVES